MDEQPQQAPQPPAAPEPAEQSGLGEDTPINPGTGEPTGPGGSFTPPPEPDSGANSAPTEDTPSQGGADQAAPASVEPTDEVREQPANGLLSGGNSAWKPLGQGIEPGAGNQEADPFDRLVGAKGAPRAPKSQAPANPRHTARRARTIATAVVGIVVVLAIGAGVLGFRALSTANSKQSSDASNFKVTSIPLSSLAKSGVEAINQAPELSINGQLRINNSFVLTPTGTPANPLLGQFYLNNQNNDIYYYNGSQFVQLANNTDLSRAVSTLNGSVNGLGSISKTSPGTGLTIQGSQLINTGVTGLSGTANQINVSAATGNITLSLPQDIALDSTPSFAGITVGSLTARSSDTALNIGDSTHDLALQGANTIISSTSGGHTTQLVFANPSSDNTLIVPDIGGTICTTAGNCGGGASVQLQSTSPGTPQTGNLNIDGTAIAGFFSGDGSQLTGLNASNINSGTLADARLSPNVTLDNANNNLSGNNTFTGQTLFKTTSPTALQVQNGSSGSVLDVDTANNRVGINVSGPGYPLDVAGNINTTTGYLVGGTQISSANLSNDSNLAKLNGNQTFTGINSFSNAGNSFTGDGSGLTALNASHVSSGTLAVTNGGTGQTSYTNGQLLIGNTAGGLTKATLTAGTGISITNGDGAITIDATGAGTCATCANQALSNLSNVAINTSLLTQGSTIDLGSGANPFRDLYLGGTTVNNIKVTGTATAARTITLPDASGTVAVSASGNIALSAAGNISFTGTLAVANGGTNSTAIPTAGAIAYGNGTAYAFTSAGTSGQILTSGGTGAPTFANLATMLSAGSNINITGTTTPSIAVASSPSFTSVTASNMTIQGTSSLTLGTSGPSGNLGSIIIHDGATSNTATLTLAGSLSGNAQFNLPNNVTGTQTICTIESGNCAGSGGGITGSGTATHLAVFTAPGVIGSAADITDASGVVTVTSGAAIQGSSGLTLGTSGVDGKLVFKNSTNSNTFTLQSGAASGNLIFTLPTADGNNGYCLQTNGGGQLAFNSCTGGAAGGVSSLNTLTGDLHIAGTPNQVSVGTGTDTLTLSTPQDIATTSNVGFRTLALNGTSAGDNLIVANAVNGATGNLIDLQVNSGSKFKVDASGNVNITGVYEVGGSQIASSNLSDASNIALLNRNSQTFTGNNELFQNAADSTTALRVVNHAGSTTALDVDTTNGRVGVGTVTPGYPLDVNGNINTSGQYLVGGSQISSANLSNDSNLAKLNGTGPQTFTGNNQFTGTVLLQPTSDSLTDFKVVNHAGSTTALDVDTTNGRVGVGTVTPGYPLDVTGDINTSGNYRIAGTTICSSTGCTPASGSNFYIQNGTSPQSSANFNISGNGVIGGTLAVTGTINTATIISGSLSSTAVNGLGLTSTAITAPGALSISSATTNAITLDSGTTGNVNVGTGANSKAIAIGNSSSGTTITNTAGAVTQTINNTGETVQASSTTAFQIQGSGAGANLLIADSTNGKIGIGAAPSSGGATLQVTGTISATGNINTNGTFTVNGSPIASSNLADASNIAYLNGNQTFTGRNTFSASSSGALNGFAVTSSSGGTNNMTPGILFKPGTSSVDALQIQQSGGTTLLNADVSNLRVQIASSISYMTAPTLNNPTLISGGTLTNGITYFYEVTAVDVYGNETTTSTEKSKTTANPNKTIGLSWTAVTGAVYYNIYRGTFSGGENKLVTSTNSLSYNDTNGGTNASATPPITGSAYSYASTSTGTGQLTVGGNGTPAGQVYVSGNLPTAALSSVTVGGTTKGLAIQGKYAYVVSAGSGTVLVVDVSSPSSPTLVSTFTTPFTSSPDGIFILGHYAYVVETSTHALQIIDTSNPTSLVSKSVTTLASGGPGQVYVQGRYAYVSSGSSSQYLQILDVSNPSNPTIVSTLTGTPTSSSTSPNIFVQGKYAYLAGSTSGLFEVVDVSNPAAPFIVSSVSISGANNFYVQGRYAYAATNSGLSVIDLSNPSSPTVVGSQPLLNSSAFPDTVYVQGRYAFVGDQQSHAFEVFDVSNPLFPFSVGQVSMGNSTHFPQYIVVSGRYLYVTDSTSAGLLDVFDMGGEYAQQFEAGGIETGTLQVDSSASFAGDTNIQGGLGVGGALQVSGNTGFSGNVNFNASIPATPGTPSASANGLGSGNGSLAAGTYIYKVVAYNNAGNSIASSSSSPVTVGSTNSITVSWTAITGATGYTLYRSADSGSTWSSASLSAITTTDGSASGPTWTSGATLPVAASNILNVSGTSKFSGSGDSSTAAGSGVLIQNTANATNAFEIQNAAGTSNLFIADTTNSRIGIGATPANGLLTIGTSSTTASGGIYFGTDTDLYRSAAGVLSTDGSLVVGASSSGNLTLNGHLITGGTAPTAAKTNSLGTTGTCTIAGTDTAGQITMNAGGTGLANGDFCTITFHTAYGSIPRVVVGAGSSAGANMDPYADNVSTTQFSVGSVFNADPANNPYVLNYIVAQ